MQYLNFEMKELCLRNRNVNYASQRDRQRMLGLGAGKRATVDRCERRSAAGIAAVASGVGSESARRSGMVHHGAASGDVHL